VLLTGIGFLGEGFSYSKKSQDANASGNGGGGEKIQHSARRRKWIEYLMG
jgi:hypothetical protein